MKHVVVGTSGHVDHGKTCLIKALTGTDTDRLAEEKKRGITIENGFAEMRFGDLGISVIDVPGHERFVRNMLAGIGGIDMALLVVGLDEGVMPQTVEHFEILKMLHIRTGIVALTKNDLISDDDWKALVEDDVRSLLKGSFMEDAEMLRVSSFTGQGIETLKTSIGNTLAGIDTRRDANTSFRLPIDRTFTIDGFGTVVTGTSLEGAICVGEEVTLYPKGMPVKVRGIQVHGENVEIACAGQRTALNLAGVKKQDIAKGQILAKSGSVETSMMLDVEIEMFQTTERNVSDGNRIHFYCGSTEVLCKAVLLDRVKLQSGERGFAQLRMEENVTFKKGDRFIIRFYSPLETIGGGVILDANPSKHKRGDQRVIDAMSVKASDDATSIFALTVKELSPEFPDISRIREKLVLSADMADGILGKLLASGKLRRLPGGELIHADYFDHVCAAADEILGKYHHENPMSAGVKREEFKSRLMKKLKQDNAKMADALVGEFLTEGILSEKAATITQSGFSVCYSEEMQALRHRILLAYKRDGFEMPLTEALIKETGGGKDAMHIIDGLVSEGHLQRINYRYCIDADRYNHALDIVKHHVAASGGITLGEFRDAIGTSRKFAVEILERFDEEKITKKEGDIRTLL